MYSIYIRTFPGSFLMTKVADMDSEDFARMIAQASGGANMGNSAAKQPSSSSGSGKEGFGGLGDGFGKLMNSSYRTSDALNDGAGIVSRVFPKLGEALGGTTKYVTESNDAINKMGKSGVNFSNDVGQYRESLAGAHMTQDQLSNMVRKNSTDFAGLGQGVNQGTQNQLKLNQAIIEQTDVQGSLAQQLMLSGTSAEDFSKASQLVTLNSRAGMLQDKERAARATQSAIELADEMDKLAKITGKSKEQQANDLEKQMRKADVAATLLQMDDQQQQNYKKANLVFGTMGDSVQDLASEIVTGGVRTKEGAAAMSALGPAGKEFEQALKQQMAARSPAEQAAAKAAMDLAKQHVTEYQTSKEYRDKLAYDRSQSGDAARKMFSENKEIQGKLATKGLIEEKTGKPATSEQVIAQQQAAADRQTRGQNVDTGKPIAGATTGQALNAGDNALQNISAGMASKFKDVNDTLAPTPENLRKFNQALSNVGTQGKVATGIDNIATGAQNLVGVKPAPKTEKTKIDENGNIVQRAGGSPGIEDFLKGGSFGGMFEQFGKGTPAILHGEEMVATKDQMTRMLSGMPGQMQGAMKGMPEQMQGMMKGMPEQMQGMMKGMSGQMQGMPEQMQSMMKGMSGQMQGMPEQMQSMMKNMPGAGGSFNASDMMKGLEGAQGLKRPQDFNFNDSSQEEVLKRKAAIEAAESNKPKEPPISRLESPVAKAPEAPKFTTPAIPKIPEIPKITPPNISPPPPPAAQAPKADEGVTQKKTMPATADVTMKDLKDQLIHLNRSIDKLVSHSADTADAAHKQVKATKSMSGNRL